MAHKLEIIDAHFHLWSPETHEWARNIRDKQKVAGNNGSDLAYVYLVEHYQMDTAGYNVTQCVHIQADFSGDPVGETKWLDGLGDENSLGFPKAIVGYCDLSSSEAEDVLKRHVTASKRFRGIRHSVMLNYNPDTQSFTIPDRNLFADPNWLRGFGLLEKYQLSFELMVIPSLMHMLVADGLRK